MRAKAPPEVLLLSVRDCGVAPGRSSSSLPVFSTGKGNFPCAADKL